jgi:hypothetical protein
MKNVKIILSITFIILFCGFSAEKGFPSDLKTFSEKLAQRKYKTSISINLFQNGDKKKLIENKHVDISIWDKHIHYKTDVLESFSNDKVQIVINHEQKVILVNKNIYEKPSKFTEKIMPLLLDTLSANYYDIKEIKKSANTIFRIRNKKEKDRVNYALFEIDNKTYVPQSIEIIYSQSLDDLTSSFIKKKKVVEENPVMVITYQNFEYLKKINPDEYDFNAFLSIDKKNNAVLTKKYSSYKLINYLKNRS